MSDVHYSTKQSPRQGPQSRKDVELRHSTLVAKVTSETPEPEDTIFPLDTYISQYAAAVDATLLDRIQDMFGITPSIVSAKEASYRNDYLTRAMQSAQDLGLRLLVINKAGMGSGKTEISISALRSYRTLYVTPRKAISHDIEAKLQSVNINTNPSVETKHVHTTGYIKRSGKDNLRKWCDAGPFVVVLEEATQQQTSIHAAYATVGMEARLVEAAYGAKTEYEAQDVLKTSAFDVNTLPYADVVAMILRNNNIKHIIVNDADFTADCLDIFNEVSGVRAIVVSGGGCAIGAEYPDKYLKKCGEDAFSYSAKTSRIYRIEGRFAHSLKKAVNAGFKNKGNTILFALANLVSTLNQNKRALVFVPNVGVAQAIMRYVAIPNVLGSDRMIKAVMLNKDNIEQMHGDQSINAEVADADIVFHTTAVTAGTSFVPLSGQLGDISFGLHLFIVDYFSGPRPKYATARDYLAANDFGQMLGRDRTGHKVDVIVCVGKDCAVQARAHKKDRPRLEALHKAIMYVWAVAIEVHGPIWEDDLNDVYVKNEVPWCTEHTLMHKIDTVIAPEIDRIAYDIHSGDGVRLDPNHMLTLLAALYRHYAKFTMRNGPNKQLWDRVTAVANRLRDALLETIPGSYAEHVKRSADHLMRVWGAHLDIKLTYENVEEYTEVIADTLKKNGYNVNDAIDPSDEAIEKLHIIKIWHIIKPGKDAHIWSVSENAGTATKAVPTSDDAVMRDVTAFSVSGPILALNAPDTEKMKNNHAHPVGVTSELEAHTQHIAKLYAKRCAQSAPKRDLAAEAAARMRKLREIHIEETVEQLKTVRAAPYPRYEKCVASAIDMCGGMVTHKRITDAMSRFKKSEDFGTKTSEAELVAMLPDHVKGRHITCRVHYAVVDGIMQEAGLSSRVTVNTRAGFMSTLMALSWLDPTWGVRHEELLKQIGNKYVNGVDGYDTVSEERTFGMVKNALAVFEWQCDRIMPAIKTSKVDHSPERSIKAFMAPQTSRHMTSLEQGYCQALMSIYGGGDEDVTIKEMADKIVQSLFGGFKTCAANILRLHKHFEEIVVDTDGLHDADSGRNKRSIEKINLHHLSAIMLWRWVVTEALGRFTQVFRDNGKLFLVVDTIGITQ